MRRRRNYHPRSFRCLWRLRREEEKGHKGWRERWCRQWRVLFVGCHFVTGSVCPLLQGLLAAVWSSTLHLLSEDPHALLSRAGCLLRVWNRRVLQKSASAGSGGRLQHACALGDPHSQAGDWSSVVPLMCVRDSVASVALRTCCYVSAPILRGSDRVRPG